MNFLRLLLLAALPLATFAVPSDPVGVFRLKLRGNSDTIVSLPLHRPALVEGKLTEREGNALTLDVAIPTLPAEGAFALVMTGALEGAVLPIATKSASTAVLETTSYDLSELETGSNGDLLSVIPYWTLDVLFPSGAGVHPSLNVLQRQMEVLLFDDTIAGKNLSSASTYFYYAGVALAGPGWYKVGNLQITSGGTRLQPQRYFIVRNNKASDIFLTVMGAVQMARSSILLATRAANSPQDNLVALPVPTSVSLGESGLAAAPTFLRTTNPLQRGDELLVFDNSIAAKNKSAAATYYYYDGTGLAGPGWYRVGDVNNTMESVLLNPGEGAIVRRKGTSLPNVKLWSFLPAYLR